MTQLHMETDNVRALGELFCQVSNALHEEIQVASGSVNSLAVNWYGPSSDDFIGEAQGVLNSLTALADEGITLALRVQREVEKWELRDFEGTNNFRGIIPTIPPIDTDHGPPETPQEPAPPGQQQPGPTPPQPPGNTPETPEEIPPQEAPPHAPPANQGQPPGHHEDESEPEEEHGQENGEQQPGHQPPPPPQSSSAATTAGTAVTGAAVAGTAAQASTSAAPTTARPPVSYDRTHGWGARYNQMQEVEQQIKELERRPFDTLTPQQAGQLQQLREQRNLLQEQISQGIAEDGPGPMYRAFEKGQCTWYASGRRNFGYDINGHAKFWGERAVAAGYEVGDVPVKGAIMVWQPNIHNADPTYGHVSFVERIEPLANGSFKVFYTDNLNMNVSFPSSVIITPGEEGVDFIYGKLSG